MAVAGRDMTSVVFHNFHKDSLLGEVFVVCFSAPPIRVMVFHCSRSCLEVHE